MAVQGLKTCFGVKTAWPSLSRLYFYSKTHQLVYTSGDTAQIKVAYFFKTLYTFNYTLMSSYPEVVDGNIHSSDFHDQLFLPKRNFICSCRYKQLVHCCSSHAVMMYLSYRKCQIGMVCQISDKVVQQQSQCSNFTLNGLTASSNADKIAIAATHLQNENTR